jgi:hypothetical protein
MIKLSTQFYKCGFVKDMFQSLCENNSPNWVECEKIPLIFGPLIKLAFVFRTCDST